MNFHRLFVWILCSLFMTNVYSEDYIEVMKKGVLHKFVSFEDTNHFTSEVFSTWEEETFNIFDSVKDSEGIAIDLGAWIGTTAIWLSKNFKHVVSVEADTRSLVCLQANLEASGCANVSICQRAVSNTTEDVIFGPMGSKLNESVSCIKNASNSENDYFTKSITFKELINEYIVLNDALQSDPISFIKCDIEGGEEDILEDLLYFAYHNKCKAFISFHLPWWKSHTLEEFEYLFRFFKTNCPQNNVSDYISKNNFGSVLFEPIDSPEYLIKKNVPAIIIGYNQFTYIKNMVEQLEKYTTDIMIVDNASDFPPLLDYYRNDFKYTLLRQKENYGHRVFCRDSVQKFVGDIYILTDPDIKFNPNLPDDFLKTMIDISIKLQRPKVGFALCIDADNLRGDLGDFVAWERNFWQYPCYAYTADPSLEMYYSAIDTTFCLVNKRFDEREIAGLRMAGDFTCMHIPWHTNFRDEFVDGEYEHYTRTSVGSHYFRIR